MSPTGKEHHPIEEGRHNPTKKDHEIKKGKPVYRDSTYQDRAKKQARLYEPCPCGSGKKYKFCCK
jgi:uncharacterized protein YchJ